MILNDGFGRMFLDIFFYINIEMSIVLRDITKETNYITIIYIMW